MAAKKKTTKKKATKKKVAKKKATRKKVSKKVPTKKKVTKKKAVKKKATKKKASSKKAVPKVFDVESLIKSINTEAKENVAASGNEYTLGDIPGFVSTGCFPLDAHIAGGAFQGGWPLGRIIEVFGAESHGKSTLAVHALISAQKGRARMVEWIEDELGDYVPKVTHKRTEPGLAMLIDSESTFSKVRATKMGLDVKKLVQLKAKTVEQGFKHIHLAIKQASESAYFKKTQAPIVIVWDTIAATPTEDELKGEMFASGIASKPRTITQAMRTMTQILAQNNILLIVVNQWYDVIGSRIPGLKETPGGRALKFHASMRVEVKRLGKWIAKGTPIGVNSVAKLIKSKVCRPYLDFALPIRGRTGIDSQQCLFEALSVGGEKKSFLKKSGTRYVMKGFEKKFFSTQWRQFLAAHPKAQNICKREILKRALEEETANA